MQIFISGRTGCDPKYLQDIGLEELLREGDCGPMVVDVDHNGPGGQRGTIFYWPGCKLPGYHPQSQTWHAAKVDAVRQLPAGRFHICLDGDSPQTLLRSEAARMPGYWVALGDGHDWAVPSSMKFPFRFDLGDAGEMIQKPTRKVEKLYERTLWALGTIEAYLRNGTDINNQQAVAYAAEMLSINYRVNLEICVLLELFDSTNLAEVLKRSTDINKLMEISEDVKKKAALTAS